MSTHDEIGLRRVGALETRLDEDKDDHGAGVDMG